VTINDTK